MIFAIATSIAKELRFPLFMLLLFQTAAIVEATVELTLLVIFLGAILL